MEALDAILTRSTRTYKDASLDKGLIEKVIEAGRYAPSPEIICFTMGLRC